MLYDGCVDLTNLSSKFGKKPGNFGQTLTHPRHDARLDPGIRPTSTMVVTK